VRTPDTPSKYLERVGAYAQRMLPGEFFCGLSAAAILGLPLPPGLADRFGVEVGVPWPGRGHRTEGVTGRKLQIDEDDLTLVGDLPVTKVSRTWCDLAVRVGLPDLVAAGDYIIGAPHPIATRTDLDDARKRHKGRRGRGKLVEAFHLLDDNAWSPAESIVRVALVRAGITGFVPNYPIADAQGTVWAYGDITFPDRRVIIEYQGDYHRDADQYRKDRTRIARLIADGWHVLEIAADQLRDPVELVRLVRLVLMQYPAIPEGSQMAVLEGR
jgi:hypothetical protein